MKIIYLIHSLHTAGGMEKILTMKANWLCKHLGYEVIIVTTHLRSRTPFFPLESGVRLIDAGVNDRINPRKFRNTLQSILDEQKPDITISLCGSDIFQLMKCSGAGVKVAEHHFMHDKFYRKYSSRPLFARKRTDSLAGVMERMDALVVLSRYDMDYYQNRFVRPERCFRIANAISNPSSSISSLDEERFICVGRLSREKNFGDALKIWKTVATKHPQWHLDIYGEGKERRNLEKTILHMGLFDSVSLKGISPEIGEAYASSSGLLITSNYEGFPLVCIEASSFGLPVVAYSCPGALPEIINDGENGFLVPVGDVPGAAERVCSLIENTELRKGMGRKAEELSKQYGMDLIMRQWTDLFEKLTGRACG